MVTFLIEGKKFPWLDVKDTVPWTYVISDLNGEEIVGKKKLCKIIAKNKSQRVQSWKSNNARWYPIRQIE